MVKRHPDVKFLMYADDGIMLSNNISSIENVLTDFKLPYAGIIFSDKLKKNGLPSCGYLSGNVIEFLNATVDFGNSMVSTERGSVSFDEPIGKFMKILWSDYNKVVD